MCFSGLNCSFVWRGKTIYRKHYTAEIGGVHLIEDENMPGKKDGEATPVLRLRPTRKRGATGRKYSDGFIDIPKKDLPGFIEMLKEFI